MRVLCVCLGNICRSPSAEAVLRAIAPDWDIDSAGTGSWHVGKPPHPPMIAAAQARGIDLSDLRARQVSAADFDRFDLILAMDGDNAANLERLRPTGNATPVRLLTDWDEDADHVPDPYYTGDFDGCLDLIEACATRLVADLQIG